MDLGHRQLSFFLWLPYLHLEKVSQWSMNRNIKKHKCSVLLSMNRTEDRHQLIVNMNTNLLARDGEMLAACIPEREGEESESKCKWV